MTVASSAVERVVSTAARWVAETASKLVDLKVAQKAASTAESTAESWVEKSAVSMVCRLVDWTDTVVWLVL